MIEAFIGGFPSNQHQWRIVLPDGTVFKVYDEETKTWLYGEEAIQEPASDEMGREFEFQSQMTGNRYIYKEFFVPGVGDKSTDELGVALRQGVAWFKQHDLSKCHAISLHSNSGTSTRIPIYPQLTFAADWDPWVRLMANNIAQGLGGYVQGYLVRSLMYMDAVKFLGKHHTVLHETGQHAGSTSAAYLARYQNFNAVVIAREYIRSQGWAVYDGPVRPNIIVPPGSQFDKYRPGTVTPPIVVPPTVPLPTLKLTSPMMREDPYGDFATTYLITTHPIHWCQRALATHAYKAGYVYTYVKDGVTYRADIRELKADGVWGPMSAGAMKHFEAEHWWVNGQRMVVDGTITAPDWEKMRVVA